MVAGAIAHSYGWRAALMVAGLASLPLVVLLLMLPEPTHESAEVGQATKESLWASLAILLRRRAFLHLNLRSEEHTSELQSLMRISYAVFCLKKKKNIHQQ